MKSLAVIASYLCLMKWQLGYYTSNNFTTILNAFDKSKQVSSEVCTGHARKIEHMYTFAQADMLT